MAAILFKVIGYLGWLITTALGVGGSWFWNFTEGDPNNPEKKRLTRAGKRAIYIMVISVSCAVLSTTYNEINSYQKDKVAEIEKQEQQHRLKLLQEQNLELNVTIHQLLSRHGLVELAAGDRSLKRVFTSFEPHISGREAERRRLSELTGKPIQFGSMGLLATFTLRDFGRKAPERIKEMACIISLMEADIVWIQELRNTEQLKILRSLLPQYDMRWGNVGRRQGIRGTGMAMLYRRATIKIIDEPVFLPSWSSSTNEEDYTWYRVPFAQTVRIGRLTIQVVNLKLYYGAQSGPKLERRIKELDALVKWIRRRNSDIPLIIAGNFYWHVDDKQMQKLIDTGFFLPTTYLESEDTESSYRKVVRRYSHFVISEDLRKNYIAGSVRYQPIQPLYPDLTSKQLMRVVDHKPLLIALDIN